MANVKSAGVREMIIDRCLQDPRGHTIEEMMAKVNSALQWDGLPPVTSSNSIRNDIENIANRWKVPINRKKRRQAILYSYEDPNFSIFDGQLTKGELRQFSLVLQTVMFLDAFQGSFIYRELGDRLKDVLKVDHFQQPILLYENIPSEKELNHFHTLFDCIHRRVPVRIEHVESEHSPHLLATVHPYFMRQHLQQWHLLGNDHTEGKAKCLPLNNIIAIELDHETVFIPSQNINIEEYYDALFKRHTSEK